MGILNTITKTVMTLGLVTAPIMLAAGLGFIEDCPAALIKGNGGTGADKAEWGAAPGAGGWPQTVISSLAKGACCGCCTTPKALAVAALQRLWRGPRCHPATSAKLLQSGAAFLGTTRANVLILLGACKLLALLDLWVLNAMPRITCLCVAVMMGLVTFGHHSIGDDLPPPVVLCVMALATAATWPARAAKGKKPAGKKKK